MSKFFLFLWEHKKSLLFLLLVLLSLAALSLSSRQRFQLARRINRSVLTPFQSAVSQGDFLLSLKQENEALRRNNFLLSLEIYRLEELEKQNRRLEKLLDFVQRSPVHFIACRVVSGGLGEQAHVFIIDKGTNHGLKPNQPVLVPEGLVGKTVECDPTRSVVQLFTHPDFRVSTKPADKEERAIAGAGPGNQLYLYNIPLRTEIKPGDLIVSTGMGGIFPNGIPVGTVVSLEKEEELGIKQHALLKPAAELDRISEVFVLADSAFIAPGSGQLYQVSDSLNQAWEEQ